MNIEIQREYVKNERRVDSHTLKDPENRRSTLRADLWLGGNPTTPHRGAWARPLLRTGPQGGICLRALPAPLADRSPLASTVRQVGQWVFPKHPGWTNLVPGLVLPAGIPKSTEF